jgi:hypothetical protein
MTRAHGGLVLGAAFAGCVLALGLVALVVVIVWPSLVPKVVADLKAEVKRQDVVGDAVRQAQASIGGPLGKFLGN